MVKNKCETEFSRILKKLSLWHLKLQVVPMSYHKMPADFIVLNTHRYLFECKQTKKSSRFAFSRLTQEHELLHFNDCNEINHSYILFLFWGGRFKDSKYFIISIKEYLRLKENHTKKSFSFNDISLHFTPIKKEEFEDYVKNLIS